MTSGDPCALYWYLLLTKAWIFHTWTSLYLGLISSPPLVLFSSQTWSPRATLPITSLPCFCGFSSLPQHKLDMKRYLCRHNYCPRGEAYGFTTNIINEHMNICNIASIQSRTVQRKYVVPYKNPHSLIKVYEVSYRSTGFTFKTRLSLNNRNTLKAPPTFWISRPKQLKLCETFTE